MKCVAELATLRELVAGIQEVRLESAADDAVDQPQCTAQERGAGVWVNLEMPLTQKRR